VYSEALQLFPEEHQQAFRVAIRALVAQTELNQMRLEKGLDVLKERSEKELGVKQKELDVLKERSEKELGVKQKELDVLKERSEKELEVKQNELDVLKERSEKELDVLKERSEKELQVKQNELNVLKERSEKELDVLKERSEKELQVKQNELNVLKERSGKDVALLKCELKHERLERDRVQGVLSLRSAIERVEGAPQNDFGTSKQRSQKWQHFFGRNGQPLFAGIKEECFPHEDLTAEDVAQLVQRLYKLLSEQVHNTGGQLVGGKIYFCAPSWVTQVQKCLLRAIVREAYGKEAVIAWDRPVDECESDSCESSPDGP
jgi:hypothetical protein